MNLERNISSLKYKLITKYFAFMFNRKSEIRIFNTCFSTTQYPFRIPYLSTQIKNDIVYHKTGFKRGFFKMSDVQK